MFIDDRDYVQVIFSNLIRVLLYFQFFFSVFDLLGGRSVNFVSAPLRDRPDRLVPKLLSASIGSGRWRWRETGETTESS